MTPVGSLPSEPPAVLRSQLDDLRVDFGKTIKNYFLVLFILTVIIAVSLVVLITIGFFLDKTLDATVLAASVQVAFGMVLGFVCVYIGLMMTWVGIDAAYSVRGGTAAGDVALKSASPGLLFALGGMLLVGVSLYKRIEYQESAMKYVGSQELEAGAGGPVEPKTPSVIKRSPSPTAVPTATPQSEPTS